MRNRYLGIAGLLMGIAFAPLARAPAAPSLDDISAYTSSANVPKIGSVQLVATAKSEFVPENELPSLDVLLSAPELASLRQTEVPLFSKPLEVEVEQNNSCTFPNLSYSSKAIGAPNRGRLTNGLKLENQDYLSVQSRNKYGSAELVQLINFAGCQMAQDYETPLVVKDLSKKGGGKLSPHLSHQNGRDVDLGIYVHKDGTYGNRFAPLHGKMNPETLEANWQFIKTLQEDQKITYIFWDQSYINQTRRFVQEKYGPEEWAEFGKVLQHAHGHKDHFHVRIEQPASKYLAKR